MALATIFVVLAVIDGPLLQRASTITTQNVSGETPLKVALAPLLPQGYTAVVRMAGDLGGLNPEFITADFARVVSDYQKKIPITTGIIGCDGNCSATVQAAGISVTCGAPVPTPFIPDPTNQTNSAIFSVTTGWAIQNCTGYPDQQCPNTVSSGGTELLLLTVGYAQAPKNECLGYFV